MREESKNIKYNINSARGGVLQRQSNFELCRIICMILILFHHIALAGLNNDTAKNLFVNEFLVIGGKIGVNVFVIIGAWFLVDKEFKFARILKIWLETFFYLIFFEALCIVFQIPDTDQSFKALVKCILPVWGKNYWFVSVYIVLLFLTPMLNLLIKNMGQKFYRNQLIVMTLGLSVIPSVLPGRFSSFANEVIWFAYLYLLTGYMKKYQKITMSKKRLVIIFGLSWLIIFASELIFTLYGKTDLPMSELVYEKKSFFINMYTVPILICSLSMFLFFKQLNIRYCKTINMLAQGTLGVYLLHGHPAVKTNFFEKFFAFSTFESKSWYVLYVVLIAITTWLICTLIDLVRIKLLEKKIVKTKWYQVLTSWIDEKYKIGGVN